MPKKTFTPSEWFHLTELAHAAVLVGLLASRRWDAGELKFQGGTSLHLIYGSPRFSEDLDFVTATTKGLHAAMLGASAHVRSSFAREFPSLATALKIRDDESVPNPRNPRLFTLTLSEEDWHQSLKVKVEFFIVDETVAQGYSAGVRALMPLRPKLRVDIAPAHIETADLNEILCDKLHALGDRERIKERDVFDLWWICSQNGITALQAAEQFGLRHQTHLAMYPNGKPLPELAQSLRDRTASLVTDADDPKALESTVAAIARWLPADPSTPDKQNILASQGNVRAMMEHAALCARETATVIDGLVQGDPDGDGSGAASGQIQRPRA